MSRFLILRKLTVVAAAVLLCAGLSVRADDRSTHCCAYNCTATESKCNWKKMKLDKPRYERIDWQVNAATELLPESGLEAGVSAPFAARVGNKLIMAGGCNFPVDPLAPTSVKKYYEGIYVADTAAVEWHRAGSLPAAIAYGATAVVPRGMILIGGTEANGPSQRVMLLNIADDGKVQCEELASLPVAIDNMAAAAIGSKVYVAGGNVDGTPSRVLYMFDTDRIDDGLRKISEMPGNPRVQPAMTAARNADGEVCLYLWGGFAPLHGGIEPTLNTDGLCYVPSADKWIPLPAPVAEGEEVSLGGGAAVTLTSELIAACGGVNKDIFINALRAQPDDYLMHPIEWYRFNRHTLVFDPVSMTWVTLPDAASPESARAGAAMMAGSHNDFYLTGGELKPRIRTQHTLHCTIVSDYE